MASATPGHLGQSWGRRFLQVSRTNSSIRALTLALTYGKGERSPSVRQRHEKPGRRAPPPFKVTSAPRRAPIPRADCLAFARQQTSKTAWNNLEVRIARGHHSGQRGPYLRYTKAIRPLILSRAASNVRGWNGKRLAALPPFELHALFPR